MLKILKKGASATGLSSGSPRAARNATRPGEDSSEVSSTSGSESEQEPEAPLLPASVSVAKTSGKGQGKGNHGKGAGKGSLSAESEGSPGKGCGKGAGKGKGKGKGKAGGAMTLAPVAPFHFFKLLGEIWGMVVALPRYGGFLLKYIPLQLCRLSAAVSFLVIGFWIRGLPTLRAAAAQDLNTATTGTDRSAAETDQQQHTPEGISFATLGSYELVALSLIFVVNVFGRVAPPLTLLYITRLKESLQATQATAVIQKIFELPHSAMIATPQGEFGQLIHKIFRNLDTLLPALYGSILPVCVEVLVAVLFTGWRFGVLTQMGGFARASAEGENNAFTGGLPASHPSYGLTLLPALLQLALFALYTVLAFWAAKRKASRTRELFATIMSEWGKLLAVAGSYERAHFFGRVESELEKARTAFANLGVKITAVSGGEHKEAMVLTFISLFVTGLNISLALAVIGPLTGAQQCKVVSEDGGQEVEILFPALVHPLELAGLMFYYVTFCGVTLDSYATGISTLRAAVEEYQVFGEFLGRISEVQDKPDAKALTRCESAEDTQTQTQTQKAPSIEFRNVSFSYGDKRILDNVSFNVGGGGKSLGLVGSSGCGKSTVIRLLLRFYKPDSGQILVDGQDISAVTGDSLRELFSVVSQDAQLFNATIRENIAYGKAGVSDGEILEAARRAGLVLREHGDDSRAGDTNNLGDSAGNPEEGDSENDLYLDKECGERGAKLSGGQQQRLSLARAILKNGCVFLLDEPTTGLDGVVARRLQDTLDEICKDGGATTLMITHHLEDLKNSDEILYLEGGRVAESGTYQELTTGEVAQAGGKFAEQVRARKRM